MLQENLYRARSLILTQEKTYQKVQRYFKMGTGKCQDNFQRSHISKTWLNFKQCWDMLLPLLKHNNEFPYEDIKRVLIYLLKYIYIYFGAICFIMWQYRKQWPNFLQAVFHLVSIRKYLSWFGCCLIYLQSDKLARITTE